MENYILDTNIFFNMEAGLSLNKKTEEAMVNLTEYAKKIKNKERFFMPPRVVDEFLGFFEVKNQPVIKNFFSIIVIKSPDVNKIDISAQLFYRLIEEIRQRSYRGLNIGEEEIENGARLMLGQPALSKKDFEIKIGLSIRAFRERYRRATRVGFLDSLADLDLIMLAKEQDGFLISTDEGVLDWGRAFGVKEMPAPVFGTRMRQTANPHLREQD